jgi:succinoglycan biosynthesis transport protein ExoP
MNILQVNRPSHFIGSQQSENSPTVELLHSVFNFVRRQYIVLGLSVLLTTALATAYLITTPPSFTAYAKLIIDTRKVQVFQQQSIMGDLGIDSAAVESQVEILKSQNIALSVVKANHLTENPDFVSSGGGLWAAIVGAVFGSPQNEMSSEAELTQRAAATVTGGLTVKRIGLTYVIEVGFQSRSREGAAQMANAIVDAYVVDQLEAKYQATRRASAWLQDRIAELKEQSSTAERAVVDFKQKNNMVAADGKLVNEQQLTELSSQLVLARKRTSDAQARLDRIQTVLRGDTVNATVTDTLNNTVVTRLRSQYLDYVNREADWSARFGPNHLAAVNLRNQMKGILASIRDELQRLAETYKSDFEIAKQSQDGIEKELAGVVAQSQETNQVKVSLRELESSAQTYRTLYDSFLQRYMETVQQQSFPVTEARMISAATPPTFKSSPVIRLVLAYALFGGLLLGGGIGWFRESSSRIFRTSKQVEAVLGKDSIAILPLLPAKGASRNKIPRGSTSDDPRVIVRGSDASWSVIEAPFSRFAEEIRSIKLAIDLSGVVRGNRIVGFTSSIPDEGKSTISTAFALLAAQAKARVILVDCDLRNPSLTRRLSPRATIGLLDVISGNAPLESAICRDPTTNLSFLPAVLKSRLANSSEVLASDVVKKLFERLRNDFDYVVVDLSPLVPVVDVRSSSSFVDSYILVVKWGATSIDTVQRALHSAKAVYDKVIGVALNKVDIDSLGRFDGESGSYYNNKLYERYGYTE